MSADDTVEALPVAVADTAAVYAAEASFRSATRASEHNYLEALARRQWWAKRSPADAQEDATAALHLLGFTDTRVPVLAHLPGSSAPKYDIGRVLCADDGIDPATLCHELAHWLDEHRNGLALSHGAGFRSCHVEVVAAVCGRAAGEELRRCYAEHGLEDADPHAEKD